MSGLKQIILISIFFVTLFSGCVMDWVPDPDQYLEDEASAKKVKPAEYLPSVPVLDFEGLLQYLNQEPDVLHVVNFWATWCKPCVAELPAFEKLNKEYKDKNVKVILVSLDFLVKYESHLIPFLEKNEIASDVVLLAEADANAWIDRIDPSWSGAIPATLIFKGDQREFYEQSFDFEELENTINSFKQ